MQPYGEREGILRRDKVAAKQLTEPLGTGPPCTLTHGWGKELSKGQSGSEPTSRSLKRRKTITNVSKDAHSPTVCNTRNRSDPNV